MSEPYTSSWAYMLIIINQLTCMDWKSTHHASLHSELLVQPYTYSLLNKPISKCSWSHFCLLLVYCTTFIYWCPSPLAIAVLFRVTREEVLSFWKEGWNFGALFPLLLTCLAPNPRLPCSLLPDTSLWGLQPLNSEFARTSELRTFGPVKNLQKACSPLQRQPPWLWPS